MSILATRRAQSRRHVCTGRRITSCSDVLSKRLSCLRNGTELGFPFDANNKLVTFPPKVVLLHAVKDEVKVSNKSSDNQVHTGPGQAVEPM